MNIITSPYKQHTYRLTVSQVLVCILLLMHKLRHTYTHKQEYILTELVRNLFFDLQLINIVTNMLYWSTMKHVSLCMDGSKEKVGIQIRSIPEKRDTNSCYPGKMIPLICIRFTNYSTFWSTNIAESSILYIGATNQCDCGFQFSLGRYLECRKWYISLITWAVGIAARGLRTYISNKSLLPMLQLTHDSLHVLLL